MTRFPTTKLLLITPFFLLLAHYAAVYPHEYAHSFTAWLLGYKTNPFDLHYGGTSWPNLLLLLNIDENVNYNLIISQGHLPHIALIAFAGPGIGNGLLYLFSLFLLAQKKIQKHFFLFYFLFLFNLMNIGNFCDYVPIRTFGTHGDMANIVVGLNISPWYIYTIGGYIVGLIMWYFFTRTMIKAFIYLNLTTTFSRATLMIICVIPLFGYFGMAGFIGGYGEISHFLSTTSFFLIPAVILACWPTRDWVKRQLQK